MDFITEGTRRTLNLVGVTESRAVPRPLAFLFLLGCEAVSALNSFS